MNILVTGSGASGSWQIRGLQLGQTIGATVLAKAVDIEPFDAVVVVKRPPPDLVARIHRAGVPLVWDVVDAWTQPAGNTWAREACMAWLRAQVNLIRPAGIVAATQAMARDCAEFGLPVLVLPHHARPGQRRNPIRPLAVVGYEGGEDYIRCWAQHIQAECRRRGLCFVINPVQLADLDIVLALRDATGYAPRHWKSNCKLANAMGSGTPFIGSPERGYMEQATGAEHWVESAVDLSAAFDALTSHSARVAAGERLHAATPTLEATARTYRTWLEQTVR